jgi:hypothetical protein
VITITQFRDKVGERFEQATRRYNDPLEAVAHLARVELAWGGHVVDVGENHIKVETQLPCYLDTAIFEGPTEELMPLFELVHFYMEASEKYGDLIVDETVNYTRHLPVGVRGVPLFLVMMAPLLAGSNRLKVAVMLACGVQDENDIKAGLGAKIDDLVAAVQLSKDGHCSFREALAV